MSVIPGEREILIFVLKAAARLLRDPLEIHDLKSLLKAARFYKLPLFSCSKLWRKSESFCSLFRPWWIYFSEKNCPVTERLKMFYTCRAPPLWDLQVNWIPVCFYKTVSKWSCFRNAHYVFDTLLQHVLEHITHLRKCTVYLNGDFHKPPLIAQI